MSVSKRTLQKVNQLVIEGIRNGSMPWRKTWKDVLYNGQEVKGPLNPQTGTLYSGINRMILNTYGGELPIFLTFNQIKSLKGSIKKGSKALPIIFYSPIFKDTNDVAADGNTKVREVYHCLKYYNVFNIEDTDINYQDLVEQNEVHKHDDIYELEQFINTYLDREIIKVKESLSGCSYNPSSDTIKMRSMQAFETPEDYYSVFLHEIIHSTGHSSRLNRLSRTIYRKEYAYEELIAETGACYLMAELGFDTELLQDNSVAYINNWLGAIERNPYIFLQAAKAAEEAVKFIVQ